MDILYYLLLPAIIVCLSVTGYLYFRYRRLEKSKAADTIELRNTRALIQSFLSADEERNLYALNTELEYTYFNDLHREDMKRVFEVDIELGQKKVDLLPQPLDNQYLKLYETALSGRSFSHTQQFGDEYITFQLGPIMVGGKVEGITIQTYEATNKIHLEQQLERHQEELEDLVISRAEEVVNQRNFFQLIIDEDPNLIFVRDRQGKFILVNRPVAETYDRKVHEVVGLNLFDLVRNRALAEQYLKEDQEIIDGGPEHYSEYELKDGDEHSRWFLIKKKRIDIGKETYVLGVQSDITHVKRTSERLEQANRELSETLTNLKEMQLKLVSSEKIASIGLLTAGLVHEINNPINYVAGNVEPLKRDFLELKSWLEKSDYLGSEDTREEFRVTSDEVDELLHGIQEGADRVKNLIANLKNLSRSTEGKNEFCDINDFMRSTVRLIAPAAEGKISIKEDYGEDVREVYVDPSHLNQVFLNILDLSISAVRDPGEVLIRTFKDAEQNIVEIENNGQRLRDEEFISMIDPFNRQGDQSTLSLAISHRIIRAMGGSITIDGKSQEGTIFRMAFPISAH